jgi:hypothetical protein
MRIIGIVLIIFGGLGTAAQVLMMIEGDMHRAVSGLVLFGSIMAIGFLGLYYRKTGYQGGAPSIIGVVMLFVGVLSLVANIEEHGITRLNTVWGSVVFEFLLFTGGFFLIRSGHKSHVSRKAGR